VKSNIALIGFMGTGKTAVGCVLAQKLGKAFIELDSYIERKAGKAIPDIFRDDGEITFRELEIEAVKEVANRENQVIACGGGLVLNKINIDRLKRKAIVICLAASPKVILRRVLRDGETRPLLKEDDKLARIVELLHSRENYYKGAAEITVNTTRLSVDAVAELIISKMEEYAGINR